MAWVMFIRVVGVAALFAAVPLLVAFPSLVSPAGSFQIGFLPLVGAFLLVLARLVEDEHRWTPLMLWTTAFAALLVAWWLRYEWLGLVVGLVYGTMLYRLYPLRFGRQPKI